MTREKPWDIISPAEGHLAFYNKHKISPVHQDIQNIDVHLDRRGSLYRCLGVLPSHFAKSTVLEIGPGSGHNSLYIASRQPPSYELVEPNATAVADINRLYRGFDRPHTLPVIHEVPFQEFQTHSRYDVCISEGWLGNAPSEREMLAKLAGYVAPGGVIVVTTVSPIGIIPNVLRKVISQKLVAGITGLAKQTEHLMGAWQSHLATIAFMSRPFPDWIQDNMLNPAYYGVCLTPQLVEETIGKNFSFYNCSPRVTSDWRWYKGLFGDNKDFNSKFLTSYFEQAHNFIDHTQLMPARHADKNRELEFLAWDLLYKANEWEKSGCGESAELVEAAMRLNENIAEFSESIATAVGEAIDLFRRPNISVDDVNDMKMFKSLFGREMLYVSLVKDEA